MGHSVLTTVTNDEFNGQRFYLYLSADKDLTTFTKDEADNLVDILSGYPDVFSENQAVPREDDEIKLLEPDQESEGQSMSMNDLLEDCPGLQARLEADFDHIIVGLDRNYEYKKTFENN